MRRRRFDSSRAWLPLITIFNTKTIMKTIKKIEEFVAEIKEAADMTEGGGYIILAADAIKEEGEGDTASIAAIKGKGIDLLTLAVALLEREPVLRKIFTEALGICAIMHLKGGVPAEPKEEQPTTHCGCDAAAPEALGKEAE